MSGGKIVSEDTYHHKDLKQQLISNGFLLLNQEGIEGFSLRKVAKMCNVSHTAPYKHFKDKDMLISEIAKEVRKKFYLALLEVTKKNYVSAKQQMVELGKAYVKYLMENPDYLKFMLLSDNNCNVIIGKDNFAVEGDSFELFKSCSENYFKEIKLDKNYTWEGHWQCGVWCME